MLYVVCYDIADERRRRRVERTLKGYGHRVQESVFEAELDDKKRLELELKLAKVIDQAEDNLRFYRQCGGCRLVVEVLGVGGLPEGQPRLMVV
ncbi:MAG TPA: CRISPR-associated endonuclease Cas2 [Myxococcota bacterium]|nr:CRISPR-associated endonuclease Cas2 [Myxococcota bacterium]HRY96625.1 CRISPR-associated endonuclease Cas2 [Myxococcota bacterium]HSA21420.1 CRISPR-associated endonuclease Cas2 [Myxococcota bacterium]